MKDNETFPQGIEGLGGKTKNIFTQKSSTQDEQESKYFDREKSSS